MTTAVTGFVVFGRRLPTKVHVTPMMNGARIEMHAREDCGRA
ncbi:hypothetical protein [Mycolicibacterium hodleri]|nr:hypothetical protein [Mycolicibacterium hodleri]